MRSPVRARFNGPRDDRAALGHPGARSAANDAVEGLRVAIAAYGSVPLWHARYALALVLVDPRDDRSLEALDRALALAPRAREVRMIAAEVLVLRGDPEAARRQLAALLGFSPDDQAAPKALTDL